MGTTMLALGPAGGFLILGDKMENIRYRESMTFEDDVRRTAEAVWKLEPGECQPRHYESNLKIRELDGIVRLRDVTHLLMVTTSRKLNKVKGDVNKLNSAELVELKSCDAVHKWIITRDQLDAEHIDYARKNNVTLLTHNHFRSRFFNANDYITKRFNAPFGSARNPTDDSQEFPEHTYIPLPISKIKHEVKGRGKRERIEKVTTETDINEISQDLSNGKILVLVAPFGAGKSLTTREIFRRIVKTYKNNDITIVPVTLNLREHWGQEYFDEILERHSRSIGFSPKEDLVVAWRAGMACLLLDGFDEVASQVIVRREEKFFMRNARQKALTGIRDFITKLPRDIGVFICGRDHYFDDINEMEHSLGLTGKDYNLLELGEFTEEGAQTFLKKNGINEPLPDWVPRKPLILGYLASNNLFHEILSIDASEGYGFAWDTFLEKICQRESKLERSVMDPHTVRSVMESLSYKVRTTVSGFGPITSNDLISAFERVTSQSASEGVLAQLQRLFGLTQREQDPSARSFVDEDLLYALQGSYLAKTILGQYQNLDGEPLHPLNAKAISVASFLLQRDGMTETSIISYMNGAIGQSSFSNQLIGDCVEVAISMALECETPFLDFRGITINSAMINRVNIEDLTIKNLNFCHSNIGEIFIGEGVSKSDIFIDNSDIGNVIGVAALNGIAGIKVVNTEINNFDKTISTNNAIMNSDLSSSMKALLTTLRKLYKQSGSGRKISALRRGVTSPEVLAKIDDVITLLKKHNYVTIYNNVVHPVRKMSSEVNSITDAPSIYRNDLVADVLKLG